MASATWSYPPPPVHPLCCGSWKTCASIWRATVFSARSLSAPLTITCAFTTGQSQVGRICGGSKSMSRNLQLKLQTHIYDIHMFTIFSWSRTTVSQWKRGAQWQFYKGSCWWRHSHHIRLQSSKEGAAVLSGADTHATTSATCQLQPHWTRPSVCTQTSGR